MRQILIGAQGTVPKLSARQVEFAKEVALGAASQSDAYRKVYSNGNSTRTVNKNASVLANDSRVQTAIEAFKTAQAYAEYQTPVQLRALVVSQLTKHILDEGFPPAQRVACLKLLGSVAEIGLFVDRKETLVIHKSDDVKARLLDQLRTITGQATEVQDDADSLLAEIQKPIDADPTHPVPPIDAVASGHDCIHTIPLEITNPESIPLVPTVEIPLESPEQPEISEMENMDLDESGELLPIGKSDENVSR